MTNINLNEKSNKTFQPFIQRDNKGYSSYAQNSIPAQENDTFDTQSPTPKKKKQTKLMVALETAGVATVLGGIAIATGKSQVISHKFQEYAVKFDSIKNNHLHKSFTVIASGLDRAGKIITNTTPWKDYLIHQVMDKTKFTKDLRNTISGFFSHENKSSVLKSMKKSRESYNEFMSAVESAILQSNKDPDLVKNSVKFNELQILIANKRATPEFLLSHGFEARHSEMMEDMRYLSDEISLGKLFSTDALQGFVPADILEERRINYVKKLFEEKNKISCSFEDIAGYAKDRIMDTHSIIYSIKDIDAQNRLKPHCQALGDCLKNYVKDSADKSKRDEALSRIQQTIEKFKNEADLLPAGKTKTKLYTHINEYSDLFKEKDPGDIGDIQSIRILAGEVWGDGSKFDTAIKKTANQHSKDLNTSLTRLVNMFDKERDITLGSGAGDVAGLIAPVVYCGWALSKDETNDERVGTGLELGIPIVGGAMTWLFALTKQLNGSNALLVSGGTSVVLNYIGTAVFKKYKEFRLEQNKQMEDKNKVVG